MFKRLLNIINCFWEYIYKGSLNLSVGECIIYIDQEGNLYVLPKNLILKTQQYVFQNCDGDFTMVVIDLMRRGKTQEAERLIQSYAQTVALSQQEKEHASS